MGQFVALPLNYKTPLNAVTYLVGAQHVDAVDPLGELGPHPRHVLRQERVRGVRKLDAQPRLGVRHKRPQNRVPS